MTLVHGLHFNNFRGDIYGGVTSAVVVLPLAASVLFVKRMSDLQLESISETNGDFGHAALTDAENAILAPHIHDIVHFQLSGALSFGGAKGLSQQLSVHKGFKALILDLIDVVYVDTSASLALEDIIVNTQNSSVAIFIVGLRGSVGKVLNLFDVLKPIAKDHIVEDRLAAFQHDARVAENLVPEKEYHKQSSDGA